jgi:hypothetical protein
MLLIRLESNRPTAFPGWTLLLADVKLEPSRR